MSLSKPVSLSLKPKKPTWLQKKHTTVPVNTENLNITENTENFMATKNLPPNVRSSCFSSWDSDLLSFDTDGSWLNVSAKRSSVDNERKTNTLPELFETDDLSWF